MSARMNVCKAGLVLGFVLGGFHLCWSILVALGWAQPVIDFVFWMHFIKPIYVIEPFAIAKAAILLVSDRWRRICDWIGICIGLERPA